VKQNQQLKFEMSLTCKIVETEPLDMKLHNIR